MQNSHIQIRINSYLKNQAEAVLAKFGMTTSQAVRMMMAEVAEKQCVPFKIGDAGNASNNNNIYNELVTLD